MYDIPVMPILQAFERGEVGRRMMFSGLAKSIPNTGSVEVSGSIPLGSTKQIKGLGVFYT